MRASESSKWFGGFRQERVDHSSAHAINFCVKGNVTIEVSMPQAANIKEDQVKILNKGRCNMEKSSTLGATVKKIAWAAVVISKLLGVYGVHHAHT